VTSQYALASLRRWCHWCCVTPQEPAPRPTIKAAQLARIADQMPVVDIGRRVTGGSVDFVRVADERGARLAVDHLSASVTAALCTSTAATSPQPLSAAGATGGPCDGTASSTRYGFSQVTTPRNPAPPPPAASSTTDSCPPPPRPLDGAAEHASQRIGIAVAGKAPVERILTFGAERGWRRLRLLSSAGTTYYRDYLAETPDGEQQPILNVFRRDGDTIRHFWGSELFYAPADPGQEPRHVGTLEPLWNLFDLSGDGDGFKGEALAADGCDSKGRLLVGRR
jgi:Bacterial protein of unknown function (DUF899)